MKIESEGKARKALAADYANMLADAVMVGEALPSDQPSIQREQKRAYLKVFKNMLRSTR